MTKLKIKQAVIVEGRHDRDVLESVIDAVIVPVNGFGIYNDKAMRTLILRYAESCGVIILTDSDNAGRQIRNYIKDGLQGKDCEIYHLYVPHNDASPEVEDTSASVLRAVFERFAVMAESSQATRYDRQWLFERGLIGGEGSAQKRKSLLRELELPENLSVTALLDVLNSTDVSLPD